MAVSLNNHYVKSRTDFRKISKQNTLISSLTILTEKEIGYQILREVLIT